MKIFVYTGPGHYIGSTVVVLAEDINSAIENIGVELNKCGLSIDEDGKAHIGVYEIDKPKHIYTFDGDY